LTTETPGNPACLRAEKEGFPPPSERIPASSEWHCPDEAFDRIRPLSQIL